MSTAERKKRPAGLMLLWIVLAVAGWGIWIFTVSGGDVPRAWRALLINFLFFSSLAGGLVVWPAVVRTCNGHWHLPVEKVAASAIPFAIPSVVVLVLLWIGSPAWAPWAQGHFHQGPWLDRTFVFGRDLAALLIFWGMALFYLRKGRRSGPRFWGAILTLIYSLAFSLLGFDLVMALDPKWYSNLAGGYFFISGLYIAVTCWGLLACLHPDAEPDQRYDIGKLIVAFSLMTTYLMYAHLLLIWYENLPAEVRFLVPRMNNPAWRGVSYFLLGVVYFGPLVLLLMEKSKKNRVSLGIICTIVLIGLWIERWWLIAPTFDPTVRLGVSELSLAVAFIGMLGLGMEGYLRRYDRSAP